MNRLFFGWEGNEEHYVPGAESFNDSMMTSADGTLLHIQIWGACSGIREHSMQTSADGRGVSFDCNIIRLFSILSSFHPLLFYSTIGVCVLHIERYRDKIRE